MATASPLAVSYSMAGPAIEVQNTKESVLGREVNIHDLDKNWEIIYT